MSSATSSASNLHTTYLEIHTPPQVPIVRVTPRVPAVRTSEGVLAPPPLLDLCIQCVAQHLSTLPRTKLPAEIAARGSSFVVQHAVNHDSSYGRLIRIWLGTPACLQLLLLLGR